MKILGDIPGSLQCLACLSMQDGKMTRAARLWGAAESLRREASISPNSEQPLGEWSIAHACEALGEEAYSVAYASGLAMSMEQAIVYALEDEDRVEVSPKQE